MRKVLILLGFILAGTSTAEAQAGSSARFYSKLCVSPDVMDNYACDQYIAGFLAGLTISVAQTGQYAVCGLPNTERAKAIFLERVAGARDETLNAPMMIILAAALQSAYPC